MLPEGRGQVRLLNDRQLLSEGSSGELLLDPGLLGGVRRFDETIRELEELFSLAVPVNRGRLSISSSLTAIGDRGPWI